MKPWVLAAITGLLGLVIGCVVGWFSGQAWTRGVEEPLAREAAKSAGREAAQRQDEERRLVFDEFENLRDPETVARLQAQLAKSKAESAGASGSTSAPSFPRGTPKPATTCRPGDPLCTGP